MPASFQVLADRDGGSDPKRFEIDVLREKLGRLKALDALATHLEELGRDVRDTQLAIASEARRPILAAYEIAKHDDKAKTLLSTALDFYGATGRKAAKTRAENNAVEPA